MTEDDDDSSEAQPTVGSRNQPAANTSNEDDSSDSSNEGNVDDYSELPTTEVIIRIKNQETEEEELFRVLLDSGMNRCSQGRQWKELP